MATTDVVEEGQETEESAPRKWNVASILLILGAVSAVGTLALWWLGDLSPEPELDVGRPVFGNVPDVFIALFYIGVSAAIFLSAYLFAQRAKNWARGSGEDRPDIPPVPLD